MPPKTKTVFQLDSPYADIPWPQISPTDQDTILDLLTNLLSPLGHHRTTHTHPSRGKRSRKRKHTSPPPTTIVPIIVPPAPALHTHVLIGLASITRHLTSQSLATRPASLAPSSPPPASTHLSAIFLTRPPTPPLPSHLPLLAHTSTQLHASQPATRLVVLPKTSEARICAALGIPRAGFVGVLADAPNARALLDYVRDHVPEVEVGPWLRETEEVVRDAVYLPVKINAVETAVPVVQKKK